MILYLFVIILIIIIYWIRSCYTYWKKRNVPYLKPSSLIFGNEFDFLFKKKSLPQIMLENYNALAPHRFGGVFSFQNPVLYIRDPELVKTILTTDFQYFYDRGFYLANKKEPLTQHLFNLTGNEWKSLRARLSPIFTSGKVKIMFRLMKECVDEMISVIDEQILQDQCFDFKELLARYSMDIIGSCAFGLKANSLRNPNSEFRQMGIRTFEMNMKSIFRTILFAFNPRFTNFLGIKSIKNDINDFFINLIKETVAYRKKYNIVRNDFLDILISLQNEEKEQVNKNVTGNGYSKNAKIELSIEMMAAQSFLFFIAGFETSSTILSFTILELSRNLELQDRLQQEVDKMYITYDGEITYDSLSHLVYMDKVIAETMRKYPATPFLMRTCTEDYLIPDSNYVIERGTVVFVPIYGFHHDPEYFPNPEKFDPDRFSEEGRATRHNFSYLPFGEGPKICIGIRFGLIQIKLALAVLLKRYNFRMSSNMKFPVEMRKHYPLLSCEGGVWVNCVKRT